MRKRKTTTEFIEELNKVNPNIEVLGEYVTTHTKILCKCKVCENEWEGEASGLLRGHGCPKCSINKRGNARKKSKDDFVRELHEANPNIEPLEDYAYARDKILFACKICGHAWKATPDSVLRGRGCPNCAGNIKITYSNFIAKLYDINNTIKVLTTETEYKNTQTHVDCECMVCGTRWKTIPNNLLTKHCGCPTCSYVTRGENQTLSQKEFEERVYANNKSVKIVSKYTRMRDKVTCECLTCGRTYEAIALDVVNGAKCMMCSRKSRMNLMLSEEERVSNRCYPEYTEFINDVLKRDDFTCQLTLNSGNVIVHHLNGYNWCVEGRTDVNNAITISDDMHKEFHSRYGYGNNTKEQFVGFVNNLFKENRLTKSAYIWVMEERLEISNHLLSDRKEQK